MTTMPQPPIDPAQSSSVASGSAGSVGAPAVGMPSLGASLVVHGALFASLIFALPDASTPSETDGRAVTVASVRLDRSQRESFDDPLEELIELPTSSAQEDFFPVEPEPFPTGPDPLQDAFEALTPEPHFRDPVLPDWDAEDLLEDPGLHRAPGLTDSLPDATQTEPEPPQEREPTGESAPEDPSGPQPAEAVAVSPQALPDGCPPPVYPPMAERRGWTGTVVLLIEVAADGSVSDVSMESSSGYSILDEAALRAVRQWRFEPGTLGGKPTALTVRKPIQFGR